ncbi:MAG: LytTR family DNA-binding domain-containing protein [Oscillospiraceae bacterium]|nr:LytTR family DNA-binding domain-containing protein [Oscillospiraceae bacterium]
MNIAICEDDEKMQNHLDVIISDWASSKNINVVTSVYPSAEAFLMIWQDSSFDLAFLDIQLKTVTGIELAKYIRKTDERLPIVFITSFAQYALIGYDVNAMHYLIKPVSPTRLIPILDKAYMLCRSNQDAVLLVSDDLGKVKLPFGDILYFSIQSHIVDIHTTSKIFSKRMTLNELIDILPSYFIRIHRSYIINMLKVDCVYKKSLLLNGSNLPISRNNSKQVNEAFIRLNIGR